MSLRNSSFPAGSAGEIPAELRERRQWVVWRAEERSGKRTKVPYRPDAPRVKAKIDNPATWGTYEQARSVRDVDGVGFVFSVEDPYLGFDLDRCVESQTGELHPEASRIIEELDGYVDPSPSGTGVHVIVRAKHPGKGCRTSDPPWGGVLEAYDCGRFFTMGQGGRGPLAPRQEAAERVLARLLPARPEPAVSRKDESSGGGRIALTLSDEELRERMFASKNGAAIRALYEGGGSDDPSAGDLALLNHLAFWYGPDPEDIDRAFRASGRMRPKWDEKRGDSTWGRGRIEKALAGRTEFYRDRQTRSNRTADPQEEGGQSEADDDPESTSPAQRISQRWGLLADPIVGGSSLGSVGPAGDAIIYLELRSGKRLRFPSLAELFDPRKQTRLVSLATRSRFKPIKTAEATEIAQLIIELCGGEHRDPLEEAGMWVGEFIASAVAIVEGDGKSDWELLAEHKRAEKLRDVGDRVSNCPVLIRRAGELWVPAAALKESAGTQMSWRQFDNQLLEIGWRKMNVDVREPTSRANKAAAQRVHRSFFVGRA